MWSVTSLFGEKQMPAKKKVEESQPEVVEQEVVVFEEPQPIPEEGQMSIIPSSEYMDVEKAVQIYGEFNKFVRRVLTIDVDYGVIPGTSQKPVLLKPGAEKMSRFFSLFVDVVPSSSTEQWDVKITEEDFPLFSYDYIAYAKDLEGRIIASCEGNCNSYEIKYRWRWEQSVPAGWNEKKLQFEPGTQVEFDFAIKNAETTGQYGKPEEYWQEWQDDIASGKAIAIKKKTRRGQELEAWQRDGSLYRVPNLNIHDQINTLKKMAQKRAFVGAVLLATGASEYFTQDLEDYDKHLSLEEIGIRSIVPDKDFAARQLMEYVRNKGEANPGEYIRDVLVDAGLSFSLDIWDQVIEVIDSALVHKEEEVIEA